ncbi:hypothetical protein LN457_14135 [Xanthomonas phaseoli]|uniref:LPD7 domain-containing protein n=1 Tax=Xanthomonas phaseoli TaxID=1985254 RepID=UPI001E33EDAA|nr:LPD7 domain-containing protein [Xanthomonas phaseoli]MCC8533921.1 hypothetical protein [Xanthomonas phaseoli]
MADESTTAGAPAESAMPSYGVMMIDNKPATAVRFDKREVDGEQAYDLSFRLNGKQVVRVKGINDVGLTEAVGERNALRITEAEAMKGSLSGEDLTFDYGVTPAESERQMLAKEDRKREELEVNTIREVKGKELEAVDMVEALAMAAKLRKRDRDEYERNAGIDGVERDLSKLQGRADSEMLAVKGLDQEADRLERVEVLDQRAGLAPQPVEAEHDLVEAEKNRRIQLMEQVNAQFNTSGPRHYFKDQPGRIAFRDVGDKLKTASNDQRVARAMVMMADAKGWKVVHLDGHPEFRQAGWMEASLRGMGSTGYKPTERDLEALAAEQERRMGNSVSRGTERVQERSREPSPSATAERSADGAQKPSEAVSAPERPGKAAEAPARSLAVHEGIMLAHGAAPYQNDPAEKMSYFVKLRTETGKRTIWGKDLDRAVGESKLNPGDAVRLEFKGNQPVTVEALTRDDKGKVIGSETINPHRNTWEAHKGDREKVITAIAAKVMESKVKDPQAREKVMAEIGRVVSQKSKAGTLPPVMMYDKAAPQRVPEQERTAPVVQRNAERTR